MRRLCLLLLLSAGSPLAGEPVDLSAEKHGSDDLGPIYEAIDEASVGRVFLTPAERRWLDAARAEPRRVADKVDAPADAAAKPGDRAAGFIRVPGKVPRVFRRDRFVPADASSIAEQLSTDSTPGIVIVRHADSEAALPADPNEAPGP